MSTSTTIPASIEELAEILSSASAEGQPVVPVGAGLHQHLAGELPDHALQLCSLGLNRILEHAPADLMVQVECGVRLSDVQRILGEHGQWLPWDPPAGANATIGGLLAAGRSGPLRLGYGTPRDWLLGAQVVLGDGRITKSGGKVVKNVAGYDSHKLHLGALGTLGVITTATFKLSPRPEQAATVWAGYRDIQAACTAAEQLRARPLSPASLVIMIGSGVSQCIPEAEPDTLVVVMRSMGLLASVARHVAGATAHGFSVLAEANPVWQTITELATPKTSYATLRIGVRPAALLAALQGLQQYAPTGHTTVGYPGVGLAYSQWAMSDDFMQRLVALRQAILAHDGYLVVEAAPIPLTMADRWGSLPPTHAIMQRLKQQWDPAGILNPGRYLV